MRIPEPVFIRTIRTLGASRANMLIIGAIYGVYALSLALQPGRWAATPAYRNLLVIMPQQGWAAAFAATSALLLAGIRWYGRRWLPVLAITTAMTLTTFWDAAFIVRWLTSASTTPETWTSWFVFDFVLLRALYLLGYEEVRVWPLRDKDHDG